MCCLRFFVANPIMSEVSCVFSDVILFKNLLDKNKETSIMKFCVLSSQFKNLSTYFANLVSSTPLTTSSTPTPSHRLF